MTKESINAGLKSTWYNTTPAFTLPEARDPCVAQTDTHTHTHTRVHMYTQMRACTCTHTHMHTQTHTHTHMNAHTYTHTHTNELREQDLAQCTMEVNGIVKQLDMFKVVAKVTRKLVNQA